MVKKIKNLNSEILRIKRMAGRIGDMRPGVLTKQVSIHNGKKYYQISYTYKMRSKTEYVRADQARRLKKETSEFKKFKTLMQKWVDTSLELSRLKSILAKTKKLDK
jgi:hypothetical protein